MMLKGQSPMIVLNDRWHVRLDDPAQWILEVRKGRSTSKATGYVVRSYCTQRTTLLRCIRESSGEVNPDALRQVETLPEKFPHQPPNAPHVALRCAA